MLEFILSTAILVGSVEIGPNTIQHEFLTDDGEIITYVVELRRRIQYNFDC